MATGGKQDPRFTEDKRQSLTCALCLNVFTQPKALPCLHAFCLRCLENLTTRLNSSTFPCPICRTKATIPAGGMDAFPDNIHIRLEDLDIAREGKLCLTHPKQNLDLYCVDCEVAVCLKCVVTEHPFPQHKTHNLNEAAEESTQQMRGDDARLQEVMSSMALKVETEQKHRQDLQEKEADVETAIYNKYATVVDLAAKCQDELLASVRAACEPLEKEITTTLTSSSHNLDDLRRLQRQVQQTLDTGTDCAVLALAKEMREGKGSARAVGDMASERRSVIAHPVLTSPYTLETLTSHVRQFFGAVNTVTMEVGSANYVVVENKFRCRKPRGTEVFSLCPKEDGHVVVSFVTRRLDNNVPSEIFEESGQRVLVMKRLCGKLSWKSRSKDIATCCRLSTRRFDTFSKHRGHYSHHLRLRNLLNGKAEIRKQVRSEDPHKTDIEFTINVGRHRGFDVNTDEQFFAVVEEADSRGQKRKVKLFQRNKQNATATYTSPSMVFQPTDVCFFTLGGQEVLLIADEAGDSIHVVRVQGGVMTFLRHLAPGHPLLVGPTALNIDHRGWLWVACRGCSIFTVKAQPVVGAPSHC